MRSENSISPVVTAVILILVILALLIVSHKISLSTPQEADRIYANEALIIRAAMAEDAVLDTLEDLYDVPGVDTRFQHSAAFRWAVAMNQFHNADFLLHHGADINALRGILLTVAIRHSNVIVIEYLLSKEGLKVTDAHVALAAESETLPLDIKWKLHLRHVYS